MGTLANLSLGQTYRVVDLGEPVDASGQPIACPAGQARAVKAQALNEQAQVVGAALCLDEFQATMSSRAFSWLPQAAYGLPTERVSLLTPQASTVHSGANDINKYNWVVGWIGSDNTPGITSSDAVAWELGNPSGGFQTITLPSPTFQAWSVNNTSILSTHYQVAGDYYSIFTGLRSGFLWPNGTDPNSVTVLGPLLDPVYMVQWMEAGARALNTPAFGGTPLIGGRSYTVCQFVVCPECNDGDSDATNWQLGADKLEQPPSFHDPDPPGDEFEGEARGVNDLGNLVGWGQELTSQCLQRAL
jgi:hypothetical protein